MNRELKEILKESAKEAGMKLKDYLINNHYCVDCGEKFEPIKIRSSEYRYHRDIIFSNFSNPEVERYSIRCSNCLKVARDKNLKNKIARESRRRDNGMCIQCGKNSPSEATWTIGFYLRTRVSRPSELCSECREKNAKRRSKYHYFYHRDYSYLSCSGYHGSDYIDRVKTAGLCIKCKGRFGSPRYPYYTCDHCREEARREARERYIPAYSKKFFESLKVGDKFPLTVTTKGRPEYKQGVITSIDRDLDGDINRINLNIGYYDLYQEHSRRYHVIDDKFNFKFIKE